MIKEQFIANDAQITLWEISESTDELLDLLDLDTSLIEQISSFGSVKRKNEYLAVRAALNQTLGCKCEIAYLPSHEPYLVNSTKKISISHTGSYATIILHDTARVGIDIEKISDKVVRVKNKFLSQKEIEQIDPRNEKTHLALHWAAKEALYKIMGIEMIDFCKDLYIEPFAPYLEGSFTAEQYLNKNHTKYNINYKVYPEFVLVWIVE